MSLGIRSKCVCIVVVGFVISMGVVPAQQKPSPGAQSASTPHATDKPAATPSSDPVFIKIGATQVKESEIDSIFYELLGSRKLGMNSQGKQHVAELYVKMMLLSQLALNEHLEDSPALKFRLEMQRKRLLAEAEYSKLQNQAHASPQEVASYYSEHQPEYDTVEIREFLVRKQTKDAEGNVTGLTPEMARTKAEAVRQALASGKSPEQVAQDFADDSNNVILIDPKSRTLRRSEMVPALRDATFATNAGQVTSPIDTPDAFLVALVLSHGHISEEQAARGIEKVLLQQRIDARLDQLKKAAGIWMDEGYFNKDGGAESAPIASK
jgi:hypothetical protein